MLQGQEMQQKEQEIWQENRVLLSIQHFRENLPNAKLQILRKENFFLWKAILPEAVQNREEIENFRQFCL